SRSDEPGAPCALNALRARVGAEAAILRKDPRGDVHPGVEARARSRARREEFPASPGTRLRRSGAFHPAFSVRPVCRSDRALQGRVRTRAAAAAKEGALLAAAFRDGRV